MKRQTLAIQKDETNVNIPTRWERTDEREYGNMQGILGYKEEQTRRESFINRVSKLALLKLGISIILHIRDESCKQRETVNSIQEEAETVVHEPALCTLYENQKT